MTIRVYAHCGRCAGDGWLLDDDLNAAVCSECDGIPTRRPGTLDQALSALVDAHRGNRSPAYAGATNYVPISVLDALLIAEVAS